MSLGEGGGAGDAGSGAGGDASPRDASPRQGHRMADEQRAIRRMLAALGAAQHSALAQRSVLFAVVHIAIIMPKET
eukprot:1875630-Pleurochrysis_carterae.AAC.1